MGRSFWLGLSGKPAKGGILIRCLNHLNLLLLTRRSSGSTPSSIQMSELSLRLSWAQVSYRGDSIWPLVFTISVFWSLPKAHDHRCGLRHRLTSKFGSAQPRPPPSHEVIGAHMWMTSEQVRIKSDTNLISRNLVTDSTQRRLLLSRRPSKRPFNCNIKKTLLK